MIGGGGQAQFLCCQTADPLTVHGQLRCPGSGYNRDPFLLQLDQFIGGNGFDLRYDQGRLFLLNQLAQGLAIKHIDNMAAVSYLHGRGIGVAIHGDHFTAIADQLNGHFATQFAGAQQHDAGGSVGVRRADGGHRILLSGHTVLG